MTVAAVNETDAPHSSGNTERIHNAMYRCTKKICTRCGACSGLGVLSKPLRGLSSSPVSAEAALSRAFSAAIDLGTTTLACYLAGVPDGRILGAASARNPQASRGPDVVSRIVRASESQQALQELSDIVRNHIGALAANLAGDAGLDVRNCREIAVAGNSVMELLFLGISPESLGSAPFSLPARSFAPLSVEELEIPFLPPETPVHIFPLIDGFVGGDTTALLYEITEAAVLSGTQALTRLAIDFGTNGEIALIHGGRIVACSTAAGPAFEGASIRHGMPALPGAVSAVVSDGGATYCRTVNNKPAIGLCGSGLVDAVALLLREGVLREDGMMERRPASPFARRIRREGEEPRCVLCESEAGEVALYQSDVRQFQLAKGAVQAGIELLLSHCGVAWEEIGECVLAGAFGNAIRHESLLETGVLRGLLRDKIRSAGNGAGMGIVRMLGAGASGRRRVHRIAESAGHLRLESAPEFQPRFLEAMRLAPR